LGLAGEIAFPDLAAPALVLAEAANLELLLFVVFLASFRVVQYIVGFDQFAHFVGGHGLYVRVEVGVEFLRQGTVGLANFLMGRNRGNPKNFIAIPLC